MRSPATTSMSAGQKRDTDALRVKASFSSRTATSGKNIFRTTESEEVMNDFDYAASRLRMQTSPFRRWVLWLDGDMPRWSKRYARMLCPDTLHGGERSVRRVEKR